MALPGSELLFSRTASPSTTSLPTLREMTTALALAKPPVFVAPPSPAATLTSYVEVYGGGINVATLMQRLGYSPALADRVDGRQQVMPHQAIDRIAEYLKRPAAEVIWACGGRQLRAPAPGVGRRVG